MANNILQEAATTLKGEIKKLKSPAKGNRFAGSYEDGIVRGFEQCREKMLVRLERLTVAS